jgi:hypothetical protein
MTPTICGYPIWTGKIKRRVAKKYLGKTILLLSKNVEMANIDIGNFVNDCTGFNGRVTDMIATYRGIGKGRGQILLDIDINTTNTSCSLCHCGVESKVSRDEVEARSIDFMKNWTLGEPGKKWYAGDEEKYQKVIARANKMISLVEAGGHFTNEDGELLEEFDKGKYL